MEKFRKLHTFKKFKDTEKIQEKWYHNLLAGLVLLAPNAAQAVDLNIDSHKMAHELSAQETFADIQAVIDFVKSNKKDFANSDKIISRLETLLRRVDANKVGEVEGMEIAKQFVKQAKDLAYPVLRTDDKSHGDEWVEVTDYSKVIEKHESTPATIQVEIFSDIKVDFNSGAYSDIDETLLSNLKDSTDKLEKLGYKLDTIKIESSTDGQALSDNLKKDLESKNYKGNNEGLSKIRNDEMYKSIDSLSDINGVEIIQDFKFNDDGVVDASERYNKVVMIFTLIDKGNTESEELVKVFYKISDGNEKLVKKGQSESDKGKPSKPNKSDRSNDRGGVSCYVIK